MRKKLIEKKSKQFNKEQRDKETNNQKNRKKRQIIKKNISKIVIFKHKNKTRNAIK